MLGKLLQACCRGFLGRRMTAYVHTHICICTHVLCTCPYTCWCTYLDKHPHTCLYTCLHTGSFRAVVRSHAVVHVQRVARGYLGRVVSHYRTLKKELAAQQQDLNERASLITAVARGFASRRLCLYPRASIHMSTCMPRRVPRGKGTSSASTKC